MARGEDRKAALIAELARARARIDGAAAGVHAHLDVGAKVQRSVARNLWWWIGGAVLTGVVIAKMPGRTKKVYVNRKGENLRDSTATAAKSGAALAVAKIVFDFAKPMIVKWASRRVADYVKKRGGQESADI